MDPRLNFFMPYERASAWHENQLTRALLVVLRYSPAAHQMWLRLVAPDKRLHVLGKPEFATQRQRVMDRDSQLSDDEAIQGISVWLAPDAKQLTGAVEVSDRNQVLDGIVTYGTDLVIVIENKITWSKVTNQPLRINVHGSPVTFDTPPVSVTWQGLLEMLSDLVDRDDLVPLTERMLISDFFELVEQHFPHVGPYSTLSRCGNHRFRQEHRLDAIQEMAVGTTEGKGLGWRNLKGTAKIFMAWLGPNQTGKDVCLRMYPADTLGQARVFYEDAASVAAVLGLRAEGWDITPNFHWGFTAAGYAWSKSPLSVDDYSSYWLRGIATTREVTRGEWEECWKKLVKDQIVPGSSKPDFDLTFTNSQRQKASPRPGLLCEYTWPLNEAAKLDERGKFHLVVRERLNQMLGALRAPLIH